MDEIQPRDNFLKEHSTQIIALSSLFVACLSLWYTIQAQKTDQEYKEKSIEPSLHLHASGTEFALRLVNHGVGPAYITRTQFSSGDKCLDSNKMTITEWNGHGEWYRNELKKRAYDDVFGSLPWDRDYGPGPSFEINILPYGFVLPANGTLTLFSIPQLDLFQSHLSRIDRSLAQAAADKFTPNAWQLGLKFEFCSLTERYCNFVAWAAPNCPP